MTRPRIKIYGERNTGTRYLGYLLRLNFNVIELPGVPPDWTIPIENALPGPGEWVEDLYFTLTYFRNLGWKHRLVKPSAWLKAYAAISKNLLFVTVTKNPYSWLLSLYKRPYHQHYRTKPDLVTFLSKEWRTIPREKTGRSYPNPVALWNAKNRAYLQLPAALPALNLRYEDILENPVRSLCRISDQLGLSWGGQEFKNYHPSTKEQAKDFHFYRDYYREERWKIDLTPEVVAIANAALDREVMDYFGYEFLTI